jgi:translocation and assembly module TamB
VTFLETSAEFPTLGFGTKGTTGRLQVDGGVVRLDQVQGQAIGGRVVASGALDFVRTPPQVGLDLHLRKVNVADTPTLWRLDEAGITGLLTGEVHLRAILDPDGVDLSGSSGEADVENAHLQGIPVKSLHLAMHAQGKELRYDTKAPGEARLRPALRLLVASWPLFHGIGTGRSRQGLSALAAEDLVALQAPAPPAGEPAKTKKHEGGIRLPSSITTRLELEDVDVKTLIARAQFLSGFPFPLPITGKLTLKAEATIPLGALRNIKQYAFHGDATIKGASVYHVDFSSLAARLDLADGVLELDNLRGRLVDHPNGGPDNPPAPAAPPAAVAEKGALPAGGFRGRLRAELAPLGALSGRFEGGEMPLGELAGPFLPRPTPVGGLASLTVEARGDLRRARDPEAWNVSGEARSVRIAYKGAGLDEVAFRFALEGGRLAVPSLTARLGGRPLKADATLGLKPPSAFQAKVDVAGWDLAAVAALIPSAPHPLPAAGVVNAQAQARGTLSPFSIETSGQGRLDQFRTGPVELGDVPFRWTTDDGAVVVSGVDAHPFGGRITAEARVPTVADRPTEGSVRIAGIDTAQITAALPRAGLKLTGKADGTASFVIPAQARAVEASVTLSAPDLTVQSIPAEKVRASLRAHAGALKYEVTAESLGGRIKFEGDLPLSEARPRAAPPGTANGEVRIAGFALANLWKALGVTGAAARLSGRGAIDANVREILTGADKGLWAHGIVELRDLAWNAHPHLAIGHVRGVAVKSPTVWRLDPLSGELIGGPASGVIWGTIPAQGRGQVGFNLRIERAVLRRMLSFVPMLGRSVDGFGTLLLTGTLDDSLRADIQFVVAQAHVASVPLSALRIPAELVVSPSKGTGSLHIRRWSARLAGGTVRGDAAFRLGGDRSFHAQVQVAGIELLTLSRLDPESRRPSSGRITGRISLSGPHPALPERYRGRVTLELDDASLFAIPVFREIDKFLGSARGGLFDDGDLVATIANKQLNVEMLTLEGKLVQLHATGTVGFDRQVNLEVLINTNQIIPQTGQALVSLIPGLREVIGRSDQAISRVSNYLSNRLLKLRVTGTLQNPSVAIDSSIVVAQSAVSFFAGVLKLPLGFLR